MIDQATTGRIQSTCRRADAAAFGALPALSVAKGAVAWEAVDLELVPAGDGSGSSDPGGMPFGEHYQRDVVGGSGAFMLTVEGRAGFRDALTRKLMLEIAGRAAPGSGK